MTFLDILTGQSVFVDTNIFLFYFGPDQFLVLLATSCCGESRTETSKVLPRHTCSTRWPIA